jgi:hypothetical protein
MKVWGVRVVVAVVAVATAVFVAGQFWGSRAAAVSTRPSTVLTAVVNADGTLARGVGAVSADSVCIPADSFVLSTTNVCPTGTQRYADGSYVVTFDRDITNCAYIATAGESRGLTPGPVSAITLGTIPYLEKGPNSIFLIEYDANLNLEINESGFHLVVVCP